MCFWNYILSSFIPIHCKVRLCNPDKNLQTSLVSLPFFKERLIIPVDNIKSFYLLAEVFNFLIFNLGSKFIDVLPITLIFFESG